jgi:hypothetical protein
VGLKMGIGDELLREFWVLLEQVLLWVQDFVG